MKTYSGYIIELKPNQVFVFGSNPEGRHGAGTAKLAIQWGAKYGQGRGLQGQTYGLVTKNLKAGYKEKSTGIVYDKVGFKSVTSDQIKDNIKELYDVARQQSDKEFLVAYTGGGMNLNGYTSQQIAHMFASFDIPENMVFEDNFAEMMNNSENKWTEELFG